MPTGSFPDFYGAWLVISWKNTVIGEESEALEPMGANPFGRIIFTEDHRMCAFACRSDRKPGSSDAEIAALFRSMMAYTGTFRIDGDRFITTADGAWNESWKEMEHVRLFKVDGDTLIIKTLPFPSAFYPGKMVVGTLTFIRDRDV